MPGTAGTRQLAMCVSCTPTRISDGCFSLLAVSAAHLDALRDAMLAMDRGIADGSLLSSLQERRGWGGSLDGDEGCREREEEEEGGEGGEEGVEGKRRSR